jgi:hypothetical protein
MGSRNPLDTGVSGPNVVTIVVSKAKIKKGFSK